MSKEGWVDYDRGHYRPNGGNPYKLTDCNTVLLMKNTEYLNDKIIRLENVIEKLVEEIKNINSSPVTATVLKDDIKIEVVNNVSSIINKMHVEALETLMSVMGRDELNFTTDKNDVLDLMNDDFVDTTYNIQLKKGELLLNKHDRYINRKAECVLMHEDGSEKYISNTIREDFSFCLRNYFADSARVKLFLKNYKLRYDVPERDKYVVVSHKHILNGATPYPHIDNLLSIVKKVYSIK